MLKDLLERMNRFVQAMIEPGAVLDSSMRRTGEALLREAESMFAGLNLQQQSVLKQAIVHVRRILDRWTDREVLAREDELARLSKMYNYFASLPHKAPEQIAEMERLRARIGQIRSERPEVRGAMGERPKVEAPAELRQAVEFRQTMQEKVLPDVASLTDAIAQAREQISRLDACRRGLDADSHELWGKQAWDEIRWIGKLIQKWNRQLDQLKLQETQARTYRWQEDKAKEETRVYVSRKEASLAKGKEQIDAIKALREASQELETAFSLCQMLLDKAHVQQMPGIIPVDKLATTIAKFEAILEGLRDKLPEAEIRQATRNLNRIKAYEAEMRKNLMRLGYYEEVSGYEATRESEGLRYFRSNLPSLVKEILSPRTVAQLENLASKGINGAKEAIAQAVIMAGKRNPERMRAILGS